MGRRHATDRLLRRLLEDGPTVVWWGNYRTKKIKIGGKK
jgi:hypothetical protein